MTLAPERIMECDDLDLAPRDEQNRYRVYRVRGGKQELLATTPTAQGVGVCLVTLHEEGEFDDAAVGVLDTHGRSDVTGEWIVNPYGPAPRGRPV